MRYIDPETERAKRAIADVEQVVDALCNLYRAGHLEHLVYVNDVARWLRLKADLLRQLNMDSDAVACERLIIRMFANASAFRPEPAGE